MSNPLNRISPLAHIVVSVVLLAFSVMGITNAEHSAAKVVYAVLIVVGVVLLVGGVRRRRDVQRHS